MAMGTASEALTSLQGVTCNMAILAGAAGGLSPKFDIWLTRMSLIARGIDLDTHTQRQGRCTRWYQRWYPVVPLMMTPFVLIHVEARC